MIKILITTLMIMTLSACAGVENYTPQFKTSRTTSNYRTISQFRISDTVLSCEQIALELEAIGFAKKENDKLKMRRNHGIILTEAITGTPATTTALLDDGYQSAQYELRARELLLMKNYQEKKC